MVRAEGNEIDFPGDWNPPGETKRTFIFSRQIEGCVDVNGIFFGGEANFRHDQSAVMHHIGLYFHPLDPRFFAMIFRAHRFAEVSGSGGAGKTGTKQQQRNRGRANSKLPECLFHFRDVSDQLISNNSMRP